MKNGVKKAGKILVAATISLTALSFGTVGTSEAHAAKGTPTSPTVPDNSDVRSFKVHYSAAQVKKINNQYSSPSGGASEAAKITSDIALTALAPELAAAKHFASIGASQWKKDYAGHFKKAAQQGKGLTITYKVDVNSQTLEGISFSS
ncbi:hypothetical protein K4U71_11510 [Staphylococcus epidermidis]|jgi:hypothetical protein|uniref:hypothetical protein n=1 Tax=Staphylococcus epidermidis TaxID=1282 RepID=UPI000E0419C6|nr:hypothetical protein [Staphylococcus epidermidis]MCG1272958.1 hypothetical protein [Staphylococcus epidermidis]SUM61063.1 Uncharacterised protein [Staphylococcus epidermidis]